MGASEFITFATGKNANAAFNDAISSAAYEAGHGGYTGTIAEKDSFTILSFEKELLDATKYYQKK